MSAIMSAMPWSNAATLIVFFIAIAIAVGTYATGRWPWEKR